MHADGEEADGAYNGVSLIRRIFTYERWDGSVQLGAGFIAYKLET